MSLENALETAKQLLEDQGEGMPMSPPGTSVEKKKKAGGDAETADGKGAESADGISPMFAKPLEKGQLGKAHSTDLSDMDSEEEYGSEEEMAGKKQLKKMMAGAGMSEEFVEKASEIFDHAVDLRVDQVRDQLSNEFETAIEEHKEHLATKLDDYLSYVVENWMGENQVAVESGIRSDINESFMRGLKQLFESHYVTMPEERYDLVDGLNNRIEALEDRLNESLEKNIELSKGVVKAQAEAIYENAARDLSSIDEEKFRKMAENVDFDNIEEFSASIQNLKENFFEGEDGVVTPMLTEEIQTLSEEEAAQENQADLTPQMSKYASMLNRMSHADTNRTQH